MTAGKCWSEDASVEWPSSVRGRIIERFAGQPDDLLTESAGMQITGTFMKTASATLRDIAESDDGQQGQAIDGLRETVGDTHVFLKQAGDMYYATATALHTYATAMVETGPAVDGAYQDAEDAWRRYDDLDGDRNGTTYFLGIGEPEPGSAEEAAQDAQDQAKYQAFQDWMNAAAAWDAQYDTWEDAWDTAVDGIEDAFDDDVKDGWSEWLDTFAEVLGWVGLIVGVAAMIIGGPILAAIAAAVAVTALVVTIVQAAMGDKDGWDIAMAAVGVIPFGKMGKLFQHGRAMEFVEDTFSNFRPSTYRKGLDAFREADSFADYFRASNPRGTSDVLRRTLTGESLTDFTERRMWYELSGVLPGISSPAAAMAASTWETFHIGVGHWLKLGNYSHMTTGTPTDWKEQFPALDILW